VDFYWKNIINYYTKKIIIFLNNILINIFLSTINVIIKKILLIKNITFFVNFMVFNLNIFSEKRFYFLQYFILFLKTKFVNKLIINILLNFIFFKYLD
jgi:hypothetical protein